MLHSLLIETSQIYTYVILAVLIVAIIVMFVFSGRRRKKQEEEAKNLINAVKPGNKVKTIGGICGIVVEVNEEENTFVLETGTEQSGKCFLKFDRQAIYQTDAVVDKTEKTEEKPAEETKEEQLPVAEEKPVEEAAPAETVEEKPAEAAEEKPSATKNNNKKK